MALWFEFAYALRLIKKNLGHTLLCSSVVAMCIAISWTTLNLYYSVALKPVPFTDADRWIAVSVLNRKIAKQATNSVDLYSFQSMLANLESFDEFGGFMAQPSSLGFGVGEEEGSERVVISHISANLFRATGVTPTLGRAFRASDEGAVAIISHEVWMNQFSAAVDILNRTIYLNGARHTILGVMPQDSYIVAPFDVYVPLQLDQIYSPATSQLNQGQIIPFGKLSVSSTIDSAGAELAHLFASISVQYPDVYKADRQVWLEPLNKLGFNMNAANLISIIGIAALVITSLGCLNIANLFYAKTMERAREFSIRNALGSSSGRLIRQSLLDTFAICIIGLVAGIVLTVIISTALLHIAEASFLGVDAPLPLDDTARGHPLQYLFVGMLTVAIWILSSLLPAWKIARQDVSEVLSGSGKGSVQIGNFTTTKLIVGLQIVCTCFLLVVCGALLYAMVEIVHTDYGVLKKGILTAKLDLPANRFDANQRWRYVSELEEELRQLSVVDAVAISDYLPGMAVDENEYTVRGLELEANGQYPISPFVSINTHYLSTLEIDIIEGRNFNSSDDKSSLPVALIDRDLAAKFWPDDSALGKQIQFDPQNTATWLTVVGVTANVVANWPAISSLPIVYRPLAQAAFSKLQLSIKVRGQPLDAVAEVKRAATRIDREIPLYRFLTMEEHLYSLEASADLFGNVFTGISFATLVMAISGIYGIISRSVLQRITEIGIRRALGSNNSKIIWLYLRGALVYLVIGCLLGGGSALLVTGAIFSSLQAGLGAVPLIYFVVCAGLAGLVAIATYLPVRKAIALEPGEALHYE